VGWCDFKTGFCQWAHTTSSGFSFHRKSADGINATEEQGPDTDKDGTGYGIFAIADAAMTEVKNVATKLVSPKFDEVMFSSGCFQFWYMLDGVNTKIYLD
jgi:hypothetical protein